jgi:hypothetical protein
MKHLKNILTAATLVAAAGSASAIQFDWSPVSFTPDSGYSAGGVTSLTKLGVDFTASSLLTESEWLNIGSSGPYTFGTVTLNDSELFSGFARVGLLELDNLDVSAIFSFTNPSGVGSQTVTATGSAVFGLIGDSAIDFSIDWDDLDVNFGPGDSGMFTIKMDDISFTANGQMKDQTYSIELVTAPIPEPETYALMLAGLGVVGFMARRRRKA